MVVRGKETLKAGDERTSLFLIHPSQSATNQALLLAVTISHVGGWMDFDARTILLKTRGIALCTLSTLRPRSKGNGERQGDPTISLQAHRGALHRGGSARRTSSTTRAEKEFNILKRIEDRAEKTLAKRVLLHHDRFV